MILSRTIGIDLGTTNSAVAFLDPNERDLVIGRDAQGRPSIPSCVWSDPRTGQVVVGHRANARKGLRPGPISSIKRSMGTRISVNLSDVESSPAQISAHILRALKRQMESELANRYPGIRHEVRRAIITVPAYFGLPAIEATRQAGELAGLEITELLHEPTAAAIYYSWKHDLGDGVYMVYDLGGGTFDVSVLRRVAGEFVVLGISGDNFLGGDDLDRRLAEHLRKVLVAEGYKLELDLASDPEDRVRFDQLMALAERAKRQLSEREEILLQDQGTLRDRAGDAVVVELALDRSTLDRLIDDLLDRTISACSVALEQAREQGDISVEQVDHVVLVGGSTHVPAVLDKVREAFCQQGAAAGTSPANGPRARAATLVREEPEMAVALGAALRAAASGLGVGDDEGRVRLWFRGAGATRREQPTISGEAEALRPDLSLDDGRLRLLTASGDVLGETDLVAGQRFAFPKVGLRLDAVNEFRFQVLDRGGGLIAEVHRSILHSSTLKQGVGGVLSTAVLPKPILLEGTDGDRLVRRVLLAEGTSLPARASFTFAVADRTGHVRLPIYQENRIIKELHAEVGPVPVGTPVDIQIECDEQVHIQMRVTMGDQSFGGRIEPPPPAAVPTEFLVHQLEERFMEALAALDEADRGQLRPGYERVREDLDEARRGGDYPKVIQRTADLEGLIREALLLQPLRPPLDSLEATYRSCLKMLALAARSKPELAPPSLRQELLRLFTRAREAHARRDRPAYEHAAHALASMLDFLSSVAKVKVLDDTQMDAASRASLAVEQARQGFMLLIVQCLVAGRSAFVETIQGRLTEVDALEEAAGHDPVRVLNRCQVLMSEAQRIYQEVVPEERPAVDLEGLLSVGAQSWSQIDAVRPAGLFEQEP